MASKSTASELNRLIAKLKGERQHHQASIDEIDVTLREFGIRFEAAAKIQRRPLGQPNKASAKTARKVRTAGAKKKAQTKNAASVPKLKPGRPAKKKSRGSFAVTGTDLILGFIKEKGSATTEELNRLWAKSKRGGKAANHLTDLVKAGRLKRSPIAGRLGSSYSLGATAAAESHASA